MANNRNDRTQDTSGQDQQKPQQGMPRDSGAQSQEAQQQTTDREGLRAPSEQARSSDETES